MKLPSIPQFNRHLHRSREIVSILIKYGLADWISRFDYEYVKSLLKARNGEIIAHTTREIRIRMALEELGPTFIKLGQILSTRPDVVGPELADELKQLQANVPADSPEQVRQTIETELGPLFSERFAQFDETPLASASIGQVHQACLASGERVVVKVQHCDIAQRVRVDMDLLGGLATLAEMSPELASYRPVAMVAEFKRMLRRELDFAREQRNLLKFEHNFNGDATVHIPRSFPELCTGRVLTMELLEGPKLSETEGLVGSSFDLEEVARRGAGLYLEMIFAHGFYHADPHPGNLVLLEGNVIGLLDFGMVGRLDETMRDQVEEMLLAILDRDAYYLTSTIMRLGAAPADLDDASFSADLSDFVDHYGNQPLEEFDLSGALREMIEIVRRYHIVLPTPLALLLKVLIMLEGTARLLNPRFSLIEVMEPYRRKMWRRRISPVRRLKKLRRLMRDTEQLAEQLPRRLMDMMQQIQSGNFDVHLDHRGLEPSVNRLVLGMLASSLFLGSAFLLGQGVGPKLWGIPLVGTSGCLLSLGIGLRLLRAISKSGHLDRRR